MGEDYDDLFENYSNKDRLISKMYSNDSNSLFYGSLGNKSLPKQIYHFDDLEFDKKEKARILSLAETEDDFDKIMEAINRLSFDKQGTMTEAHARYTITQKDLASAYASIGEFELAEQHLNNSTLTLTRNGQIVLQSKISKEEMAAILKLAIERTNPSYFIEKLTKASEEGDIKTADKYASLTYSAFKARGVVPEDDSKITQQRPRNFKEILELYQEVSQLHRVAYRNAIKKEFEKALGEAVVYLGWRKDETQQKLNIQKSFDNLRELLLAHIEKFVPSALEGIALQSFIEYFNTNLTGLESLLLTCVANKRHPIRSLFTAKEDYDTQGAVYEYLSSRRVTGANRIEPQTKALVPLNLVDIIAKLQVSPRVIDEFFEPIIKLYAEAQ